jgi:hypothetical protein
MQSPQLDLLPLDQQNLVQRAQGSGAMIAGMGEAVGAVVVFAVGVGLSPIPVIAVVLILFSARARVNGPVFLGGWVLGLSTVFAVFAVVASALDVGSSESADDGVKWLKLALGVALLVAAARKWRSRPRGGEEAELPGWMSRLDDLTPSRALGMSLVLAANPKNLVLATGAAASVAQLGATAGEWVVAGGFFVSIGSAIVIFAVAYDRFGGERSRHALGELRSWMTTHNAAVMTVLLLVFGAVLVSQGLGVR